MIFVLLLTWQNVPYFPIQSEWETKRKEWSESPDQNKSILELLHCILHDSFFYFVSAPDYKLKLRIQIFIDKFKPEFHNSEDTSG